MNNEEKYIVCQRIDDPTRYFGLTIDELIPVLITIVLVACVVNLLTSIIAAAVVWVLIRHFKKGHGMSWLLNLLYWHLPSQLVNGVLFVKTPPSSVRHWLS